MTIRASDYAFNSDGCGTPILNVSWSNVRMSGDVSDIGMMMDAITRVGWRLHTWAVTSDKNGHPQAMPLFIR